MFETEEQLVRFLEKINEAAIRNDGCGVSRIQDTVAVVCKRKGVDPSDDHLLLIGFTDALTVLDAEGVPDHEIMDPRLTKEEKMRRFGRSRAKQVRRNLTDKFDGDYDQEDVSLLLDAFCDELTE